uniref:Transcription factor domain-containing protein n=1 Tax=Bionectria ochroleuca TaxID=29856 RepID=A0A8H7TPI4_BIOOC
MEEHCHREPVRVVTKHMAVVETASVDDQATETFTGRSESEDAERPDSRRIQVNIVENPTDTTQSTLAYSGSVATIHDSGQIDEKGLSLAALPSSRLTNDKAASLEFLAYGRRGTLNHLGGLEGSSSYSGTRDQDIQELTGARYHPLVEWDPIFPLEEARALLHMHGKHIAWMHNVVHMPSFIGQFDINAASGSTMYHIPDSYMKTLGLGIVTQVNTVRELYDKSIDYLYRSNFISKHNLTSVQAICVLLQVAHHYDQSDTICVLLAAAIRIAQCLNINRLGLDPTMNAPSTIGMSSIVSSLIEREVKKRVWWFLVRQDWLQIPFQNTCLIHFTQFNTPMPVNCFENADEMISDGRVVAQPENLFTQTSFTHVLNQVAVIIWKHQDRLCQAGFPGDLEDGLMKLYDQTTWADKELKKIYSNCASFLQYSPSLSGHKGHENAPIVPLRHLACVVLLSTAHKIFTVHRHFQLRSFRDTRFAYTQLSCMSLAERSIRMIENWENTLDFEIAKRMWTTPTQIITCCITLLFALMFRFKHPLMYEYQDLRECINIGRFDHTSTDSQDIELEIGDVIRRVAIAENSAETGDEVLDGTNEQQDELDILELWDEFIGETDLRVFEGVY